MTTRVDAAAEDASPHWLRSLETITPRVILSPLPAMQLRASYTNTCPRRPAGPLPSTARIVVEQLRVPGWGSCVFCACLRELGKRRLLIGRYRNRCHRLVYVNELITGLTAVAMERRRRRRRFEASPRSRESIMSYVLCSGLMLHLQQCALSN